MQFPSFISLPYKLERAAPPFETNAIRFPESLVRYCLKQYTKPGARILDPFAGLGTSLFVAEELKRVPYGIEADSQRFEWVAGQLQHWQQVVWGDAARMDRFNLPKMDFCITSPPFMQVTDKWNPLYGGDPRHAGYPAYLKRMRQIFGRLPAVMKKGALVVVQVDNIPGRRFTPLVHDLAAAIGHSLTLQMDMIVKWQGAPADYPYTHCLIFKNA